MIQSKKTKEQTEQSENVALTFDTKTKIDVSRPKLTYSNIKSLQFSKLFIFYLFQSFLGGLQFVIITLYLPQYFGECLDANRPNYIQPDCEPNLNKLTTYGSYTVPIGIAIQFFFAAFIGRLTDSFGRKSFLIIPIVFSLTLNIICSFYFNIWIYTILNIFANFISWSNLIKTMISDTINPKQVNNAYGALTIASAIGNLSGLIVGAVLSTIYGNHVIFYISLVVCIILLIYIFVFVNETIDINNNRRVWNQLEFKNPLRPVLDARKNRLILWICIISVCQMFAMGFLVAALSYIGTELGLKDFKLLQILVLFTVISAISAVLSNGLLLPLIQKHMNDINIMILAVSMSIIAMMLFGSISFAHSKLDIFLICSAALIGGIGSIYGAIESGIISKMVRKDCKGTAFGILTAYQQIALIFGILINGLLYDTFDKMDMRYIIIVIGIFFLIIAVILIKFPLKKELNKQYSSNDKIQFVSMKNVIETVDQSDIEISDTEDIE
eukprot:287699_1